MKPKNSKKQQANRRRHNFLIDAFFKNIKGYAVNKSIPNWVLVKHLNGNTGDYEVAIYTEDAYKRYEVFNGRQQTFNFPNQVG